MKEEEQDSGEGTEAEGGELVHTRFATMRETRCCPFWAREPAAEAMGVLARGRNTDAYSFE